jgi:hypothetical protein
MALPFTGAYAARYAQPYHGAGVWGTGINPVHLYYGSPPVRLNPTRPLQGRPQPGGPVAEITQPWEAVPEISSNLWGYTHEDSSYTGVEYDNRPSWGQPEDDPTKASTFDQPSYNASGAVKNDFRAAFGGAFRTFRGKHPRADYMIPTETVSEGWLNKAVSGVVAVATPSDPAQYERQTSMQQRFQTRGNQQAVGRNTDEPRAGIASRVQPQLEKVYSGQERHYDMFPQQQSPDALERPFYYRTAGTGQADWMLVNEQWDINARERTPPPDPYIGYTDTAQYGYTPEDYFYA